MRAGSLAKILAAFPDDYSVRPLLEAQATTGAVLAPVSAFNDAPVLWVYGPTYGCKRVEDIPAYVRASDDALWYVRPASPGKAIDLVRGLLSEGVAPANVGPLAGVHKTLVYRELRERATRGVCPCCGQKLKADSPRPTGGATTHPGTQGNTTLA